jgi:hypothetical protein
MKLSSAAARFGTLLGVLTMLTGCVTPALWAKKPHQPAEHPRLELALAKDGRDVLVCYDERMGQSPKVHRRAYWLFAHSTKVKNYHKPEFTSPATGNALSSIAVIDAPATNTPAATGYSAVAGSNSRSFHLWQDGREVGVFNLPVYDAAPLTPGWRAALTPLAAAADVAIVGTAILASGSGGAAH